MTDRRGPTAPPAVREMFDRIAPIYDAMNSLMTGGTDARWRRQTVASLSLRPGQRVLDVATGTGKLALAEAAAVGPSGEVVGLDVSGPMLERARRAEARHAAARADRAAVRWLRADAMHLPFDDGTFDAVTIGFGLRNLPDIDGGLHEMARVLRPGGRAAVLEIAVPRSGPGRILFSTWFRGLVPWMGRLVGRGDAYAYLPWSLERYPAPEEIARRMADAGLEGVRWQRLRSGMATLHVGKRGGSQ